MRSEFCVRGRARQLTQVYPCCITGAGPSSHRIRHPFPIILHKRLSLICSHAATKLICPTKASSRLHPFDQSPSIHPICVAEPPQKTHIFTAFLPPAFWFAHRHFCLHPRHLRHPIQYFQLKYIITFSLFLSRTYRLSTIKYSWNQNP